MQQPNVEEIRARCIEAGVKTRRMETTYYLGREQLIPVGSSGLASWRKRLFSVMSTERAVGHAVLRHSAEPGRRARGADRILERRADCCLLHASTATGSTQLCAGAACWCMRRFGTCAVRQPAPSGTCAVQAVCAVRHCAALSTSPEATPPSHLTRAAPRPVRTRRRAGCRCRSTLRSPRSAAVPARAPASRPPCSRPAPPSDA